MAWTKESTKQNIERLEALVSKIKDIEAAIKADDVQGVADLVFDAYNHQAERALKPLREYVRRLKLT